MFEDYITNYGPSVFGGAIFFCVAWLVAHWAAKAVCHLLRVQLKLDPSISALSARIVSISILILAGIAVLDVRTPEQ